MLSARVGAVRLRVALTPAGVRPRRIPPAMTRRPAARGPCAPRSSAGREPPGSCEHARVAGRSAGMARASGEASRPAQPQRRSLTVVSPPAQPERPSDVRRRKRARPAGPERRSPERSDGPRAAVRATGERAGRAPVRTCGPDGRADVRVSSPLARRGPARRAARALPSGAQPRRLQAAGCSRRGLVWNGRALAVAFGKDRCLVGGITALPPTFFLVRSISRAQRSGPNSFSTAGTLVALAALAVGVEARDVPSAAAGAGAGANRSDFVAPWRALP
jgi:hypothetical protein